jgi:hypothetical protein
MRGLCLADWPVCTAAGAVQYGARVRPDPHSTPTGPPALGSLRGMVAMPTMGADVAASARYSVVYEGRRMNMAAAPPRLSSGCRDSSSSRSHAHTPPSSMPAAQRGPRHAGRGSCG